MMTFDDITAAKIPIVVVRCMNYDDGWTHISIQGKEITL